MSGKKEEANPVIGLILLAVIGGSIALCTFDPPTAAEKATKEREQQKRKAQKEYELKNYGMTEFDFTMKCRDAVKNISKFPSKAKISMWDGTEADLNNDKEWVKVGRAELMNGFGAMIPHKYICRYDKLKKRLETPLLQAGG